MADDDQSGTKPAPVVLRIKLRYDDLDTFVDRFAANIGKAGLFVHSKTPRPVATEVKFELRLADDKPILVGVGTVRESRMPDPERPREPSGMMIAFTRVTRDSRDLLLRVLEFRKAHGMYDGPGGMPLIGERELSGVRPMPRPDSAVPVAMPMTFESQPVGMPPPALHVAPPPPEVPPPSKASADAAAAAMQAAAAASMAAAAAVTVEPSLPPIPPPPTPLLPEPARRARPRPQELIAAATGAIQTTTAAVDETVDLASVIARARTIITGDLDDELAALGGPGGPDATPAPISPDEASNQLATMLGVAVRRATTSRPARAASERAFAERAAEAERVAGLAAAERARSDEIAAERATEARRSAETAAETDRAEVARIAAEREARRVEAERAEAERDAAVRIAHQRAAQARQAAKADADREERIEGEEREAQRLIAEREGQRIAAEREAAKRLVAERAESMRIASERAEHEHAAATARETERAANARESERAAAGREADRVAAVRAAAERAEVERSRASSPILDLGDDDESTAASAEPPLPPELDAGDAAVTHARSQRPVTPVSEEDPATELAATLNRGQPIEREPEPEPPPFVPDSFEDDPDTAYSAEIPGHAKRWMPRLESDIEFAIDSALTEQADDQAPGMLSPAGVEVAPESLAPEQLDLTPPAREGTLDAGFEILSEADDVADAVEPAPYTPPAYTPPPARVFDDADAGAIPSMVPSESAYRSTGPDDFEDEEGGPIHFMPSPVAPAGAGAYSISRARSDDGTIDYDAHGDALEDAPRYRDHAPDDEPPLTLPPEPGEPRMLREPAVPDDFRHYDKRYDATPEPIDDFADRLDLSSRSVSLLGRIDFDDLAPAPREESDLYIDANEVRAGTRDAEDMYGARPRSGSVAPETDDDLGDIADPPMPAQFPEFDGEDASAPYMERPPLPAEEVYESGRHSQFTAPSDWDQSDVHEAAPEVSPVRRAQRVAPPPMPVAAAGDDDAEEIDLDSALEDLDVDLGGDDHPPKPPAPKPAAKRAVTDDGIPIDFDDDD